MGDELSYGELHDQYERLRHRVAELEAEVETLQADVGLLQGQIGVGRQGAGIVVIVAQTGSPPVVAYGQEAAVAQVQMNDGQEITFAVVEEDAAGQPVAGTTPPQWQVSDTTVLAVTNMSADGLSATVGAAGAEGTATVTITVPGAAPDGSDLTGSFDIEVTAGPASQLNVTPGAPEAKGTSTLPPVSPPGA